MNITDRAAIESSCKFIEEQIASRKCDNDAVGGCWRCNSVYLAKRMRDLLNIHPAAPTIKDSLNVQSPPVAEWPECKKCGSNLWQCMACHPTPPQPVAAEGLAGDSLIRSAQALLNLDAAGALAPHGIGGHARTIIQAFINQEAMK